MTSDDSGEGGEGTLELPELPELLRLAVGRGWLTVEEATKLAREAEGDGLDVVDLLLDRDLLGHQQIDVLLHLLDPTGLVPGYEILDVLGQGAMGVVYRARQLALQREVALKTIRIARLDDRQAVQRARAEALTVARLSHPNVAAAYDQGVHDGRLYLAMEFVDGENWDDRISRDGPMDERIVWGIARQVAAGLAHAEEHDVVHRDVKPANVLLTKPAPGSGLPDGVPLAKITDFGIALGPREENETRLTRAGAGIGTPDYVAPEQLLSSDVDLRADVYALGASVCHALLGERLFESGSVMSVVRAKMTGDESWRRFPDSASPASVTLLERMTSHEPSERIGDYATLISEIDAALDQLNGRSGGTPVSADTRRPVRRRTGWIVGGLVAAILTVAALVIPWGPGVESVPPRATNLERSGRMVYLFDGESTPIGRQRGKWEPTRDELGGTRLSGTNGWITFSVPTEGFPVFQFQFGLDLGSATAVEVHFPVDERQPTEGERRVVRLTTNDVEQGGRPSLDGEFRPTRERSAMPPSDGDYHSVEILRQADAWYVDVEDTEIGGAVALGEGGRQTFLLRVVGGTAHFEGVEVVGLEPATP